MKRNRVVLFSSAAMLATAGIAQAEITESFTDIGGGFVEYAVTFTDELVQADGQLYGFASDGGGGYAGAEVVYIGWTNFQISSGSPLSPVIGDDTWVLWRMGAVGDPANDGWYYGVPFGGESGPDLGPSDGGFNVAGAGYQVATDGVFGGAIASFGNQDALLNGSVIMVFENIPGPGAFGLLAIAGAMGVTRRRR